MSSPQAKTGVEVERLIGEALAAGPTDGNWELCYLDTPLEQVGAYVQKCVEVSGGDKYHFIRGIRPDGVPIDVAHYGNGPTSNINGHWATVTRPENIRQLLAALAAERAEAVRIREENEKLRADLFPLQEFMDSIFGEFPDHGDIDGFDLQDIAEACGLLKKEATVTPCGEHCGCAENGIADGTETQCYRVQPVMRRARIAVAKARAAISPSQGGPNEVL